MKHRFQIENDRHHWKNILTMNDGVILHMDYSENVSGSPKKEPQDAHFNKKQFSLHCTVGHEPDKNVFFYHLANERNHDHNFTDKVVNSLVSRYRAVVDIFRSKSDNCTPQYKCLNVFPLFRRLAMKYKKTFVHYYGVKGHGKGLVDAMSGFGLKTPLKKAIVTHDVFYDTAEKICNFISEEMKEDDTKVYECLVIPSGPPEESIEIPGSQKLHMISYFANGEIQVKEEICSCRECFVGNLVKCQDRTTGAKGKVFLKGIIGDSSDDSESENENNDVSSALESHDEFDNEDNVLSDMEENELFAHTDYTDAIDVPIFIALYAHEGSNTESFFLCQVNAKKTANEGHVTDDNNHLIPAGTDYMVCKYLDKGTENFRKGYVQYSLSTKDVYITYDQVMFPGVILSEFRLSMADYIQLSDISLSFSGR